MARKNVFREQLFFEKIGDAFIEFSLTGEKGTLKRRLNMQQNNFPERKKFLKEMRRRL